MRRASRRQAVGGTRHQPIPLWSHPLGGGWISSDTPASIRRTCIAVWGASRQRVVYTMGIVVPLVALALVAALGGESSRRVSELPNGGILEWIFPRSAIREVVVYAGVVLWLLREIRRRTPDDFRLTLWRAPVIVAIANVLLAAPFVLVNGSVRELLAEQAGRGWAPVLGPAPRRLWLRVAARADPGPDPA